MTSTDAQALIEEAHKWAALPNFVSGRSVFTRLADALESSEDARVELVTLVEEFIERLERSAEQPAASLIERSCDRLRREHAATLRGFLPRKACSDG